METSNEYTYDLSICLLTYNHEKFILSALEGIRKQVVNFKVELLIADDCSDDNTRNLINEFLGTHKMEAKLFFPEKNTHCMIWKEMLNAASGKYKAHIDGDDYWVDPLKCQKQVDFLNHHPQVSFCYTNGFSFVSGNESITKRLIETDVKIQTMEFDEFLTKGSLVTHSSKIWRSSADLDQWPGWVLNKPYKPDYFVNLMHLQSGPMVFLNFDSFKYRIHSKSMLNTHSRIVFLKRGIEYTDNLNSFFDFKYKETFEDCKSWHFRDIALEYINSMNYFIAIKYAFLSIKYTQQKHGGLLGLYRSAFLHSLVPDFIKHLLKKIFRKS